MKIVFICNEAPFPSNHGGRVDVWRRLCAMHSAGAEIFLVFWAGDKPNELPSNSSLARMRQEVKRVSYFVISRTFTARLMRLVRLVIWPSHVASRVLRRKDLSKLMVDVKDFCPDAVWLESIYGGVLARNVADLFAVPLFCRSHNIEHLYMADQVAKATTLRDKIAWRLNLPNLRRFEYSILRKSKRFFDISSDDLGFWSCNGMTHGEWLPPMVDSDFVSRLSAPRAEKPGFDVGYLGNLYSPNNVDGVCWFLDEVVPILRRSQPEIRVFIAGLSPNPRLREAVARNGVALIENPSDIVPVLRSAMVLVNPVFAGSGVNIKSMEMLFSPALLVATCQGVAGLPPEVSQHFRLANTAEEFSSAVLGALDSFVVDVDVIAARREARELFASSRASILMKTLSDLSFA